ncbi:hypothetical protein B0A54_15175 [Friedmanniomyces endolithicus]|uniref:Protein kinase domain-containing protein n=1 Tax=Friedmanniomyces endolithicus TaxID=329885 RepID=A0A4U0U605_9PEZI|nr:hypothetical protein LTS09_014871 [Friedmanniomyces endolithicus]TKA30590.1 hypothetical protein B0A54_15175 [Friedmanniomyces endolithicus]
MNVINEGAEFLSESGKTYLAVSPLGQANVWTAVDKGNLENIVVLKSPAPDDTDPSWPQFQHEMIMHELLKTCTAVRKQIDRIPPVEAAGTPPILVLEIMQTTLWSARTKRPFTKEEVRSVARQVLRGLKEIHDKGLVYADLKMQNVMINGFDTAEPGVLTQLEAKLGDLGIVMYPQVGTVQPVAYRAPEVFFKGAITPAADIWGFGLIYCHLLEAIERFDKTGLYDDLNTGGGSMREREQAMRYALGNDYDLENVDYYKDCALPYRSEHHETGHHWGELRKRGLDEEDIEFLQWILRSDPSRRPSAAAILDSDILNPEINGEAHGDHAGQVEGAVIYKTAHEPLTEANGHGPSKRQRREDAESSGPAEMATVQRPEAPERGISQANFTPGVALPDNSNAGKLLDKRNEHVSPILEHPMVQSVIHEAAEEHKTEAPSAPEQTQGGVKPTTLTDMLAGKPPGVQQGQGGAESLKAAQYGTGAAAMMANEAPKVPQGGVETASAFPSMNAMPNGAAFPERPTYLAHIGKKSSTGGTWLSYQ